MKTAPDKVELRMRRAEYGPVQCSLASPAPGTAARFRRWNKVLIAILVFVVLGAFVAAEAPRSGSNSSSAALKESAKPPSAHHANSIKNSQFDIPGHTRSGYLNKDVTSGHHAS